MTSADKAEFGARVLELHIAYKETCTTPAIGAYWSALKDLTLAQATKGFDKAARCSGEFIVIPPPGRIREYCGVATVPYHAPYVESFTRAELDRMHDTWKALPAMKEPKR